MCELCDKDFNTPKKRGGAKTPKKATSAKKWAASHLTLSTLVKWTCLLNDSIWAVQMWEHCNIRFQRKWKDGSSAASWGQNTTACGSFSLVKWNKLVMETICSFPFVWTLITVIREYFWFLVGKCDSYHKFWCSKVNNVSENISAVIYHFQGNLLHLFQWMVLFGCCVCGTVNATKASWCSSVSMHFLRIFFPLTSK